MGYFVSQREIIDKNKNIDSALALTLFLGIFGMHRFYFRRYLSGCIILVALILTAGQALWIIIPLVFVEFIKFGTISERNKKSQTQVSHISVSQERERNRGAVTKNISAPPHKTIGDVVVHDVSDIETSRIHPKEHTTFTQPTQTGKWTKQLELPYERHDLRIPQLRKATYIVFEKLANHLDKQLRNKGSSLDILLRQIQTGGYSYYDNLLYTIFCVAEGEVTEHYSGGYRGYDNSFSYELLERRIDKSQVEALKQYAQSLLRLLPSADTATKEHFRLTESGLPIVWWDKDGSLRATHRIPDTHMRILRNTPSRNTKIYDIPEVRGAIFTQYFKALSALSRQRRLSGGWSQRMTRYLDQVFSGEREWIDNPHNVMILSHLLKLSEQAVRLSIPYARPLDVSKELASIPRIVPKDAAVVLLEAVNGIEPPKLSESTLDLLRAQNPTAWKYDIADIESASTDNVIALLNRYNQAGTISKVAKEIIKKHDSKDARLLALYQVAVVDGVLDQQLNRQLRSLVHEAQESSFAELVAQKKKLSASLAHKLVSLQHPPRKRVILDEQRLSDAHNDHQRAVSSVVDYLGDEDKQEDAAPPAVEPAPTITQEILTIHATKDVTLEGHQKEFIRHIVDSGNNFDISEAGQFAKDQKKMLNGYIQVINKQLFNLFDDQVIIQQDGKIKLDEHYVNSVKELL